MKREPVEHIAIRSHKLAEYMLKVLRKDGTPEARHILKHLKPSADRAQSKIDRPRKKDPKKQDWTKAHDAALAALSAYIRTRDTRPYGETRRGKCVTCENWKTYTELGCGHWQSRALWGTKFHPFNNHAQCWGCNSKMMGNGRQKEHEEFIRVRHGQEWVDRLMRMTKTDTRERTADELRKIAEDFEVKTAAHIEREQPGE